MTETTPIPLGGDAGARARELARLILGACERSGLTPGARLPTERQLAAQLGVGRTAVRHALGLLEAQGRLSREVGRGTFLCAVADGLPQEAATGSHPIDTGPADVMTARQALEPQVVPLVVARATALDFEEFDRCLGGGAGAGNYEEFEAWDFALHHAIFEAGHNPLLVRMYAEIEAARGGQLWGNLKRRNDSRERRAAYQRDHETIVAALRARELEHALEATRAHLDRVRANLLGRTE
ncbi:MAG TPA: FCD domain-containing protein [Gaiellaceae bacterium]|nr:FCD domain-containing protein [Gaiellaceae bacterium]